MTLAMKRLSDIIADELRDELKSLLLECTEAQNAFFHRSYPGGMETMTDDTLRNVIALCRRTIARNEGAV
jgi:hypothetical protein